MQRLDLSLTEGAELPGEAAVLERLDAVEQDATPAEEAAVQVDPLAASPGQSVDGDWVVERILGTGATARALLVTRDGRAEGLVTRADLLEALAS